VGTPVTVQQKLMRHADIRTTINIRKDVLDYVVQELDGRKVRWITNGPEETSNG
jgi:hypothetical protein